MTAHEVVDKAEVSTWACVVADFQFSDKNGIWKISLNNHSPYPEATATKLVIAQLGSDSLSHSLSYWTYLVGTKNGMK